MVDEADNDLVDAIRVVNDESHAVASALRILRRRIAALESARTIPVLSRSVRPEVVVESGEYPFTDATPDLEVARRKAWDQLVRERDEARTEVARRLAVAVVQGDTIVRLTAELAEFRARNEFLSAERARELQGRER